MCILRTVLEKYPFPQSVHMKFCKYVFMEIDKDTQQTNFHPKAMQTIPSVKAKRGK